MNTCECLREQEVMDSVACGRWPERAPADLREHLAHCALCASVLEVALALHEEHDILYLNARVPPPGLVWWRAELRARQEAMRSASRPMTLVQAFGGACAFGVALALLSRAWPWLKNTIAIVDVADFSFSEWSVLLAAALLILIIAPVAMYLVLSDE